MKIMVVDDSFFVRTLITKTLQNIPEGEIVTACNGQEAYDLLTKENPNVIVTDLLMPEMNGWELIKLIKQENQSIKIIVISSDIQTATRTELEQLGISAFINKPFNNEKADLLIKLIKGEQP